MKPTLLFLLASGISICSINVHSQQLPWPNHITEATLPSENSQNQVLEVPIGAVDGRNATFFLNSVPLSSADVRITVDGEDVTSPWVSVKDQTVQFDPPSIPKPGALVRAVYATQGAATSDRASDYGSSVGLFANMVLLRMIEAERSTPQVPASKRAAIEMLPLQAIQRYSGPGERALSLLARRLAIPNGQWERSADRTGEKELRSLIGIEGTGDRAPAQPYDQLFALKQRRPYSVTPQRGSVQEQSEELSNFRSLKMLGQRLHQEPAQ